MSGCSWEKIEAFQSPMEYRRFVLWIEIQLSQGICEEIPNDGDIAIGNDNRIFKCMASGERWKLSFPDPGYFPGSWLPENEGVS